MDRKLKRPDVPLAELQEHHAGSTTHVERKQKLTAEIIAAGLLKAKRVGPSKYIASCPAHDDRTPSLSIKESHTGKILVHCFAGCSQDEVISALRNLGLWSKPSLVRLDYLHRLSVKEKVRFEQLLLATATTQARDGWVHTEFDRARIRRAIEFLEKHGIARG